MTDWIAVKHQMDDDIRHRLHELAPSILAISSTTGAALAVDSNPLPRFCQSCGAPRKLERANCDYCGVIY